MPPPPRWSAHLGSGDRKLSGGDRVFAAQADQDGRFEIAAVGPERIAHLTLAGPGIATAEVVIVTRAGFDPTPYNRATLEKIKSPYSELGYHPMLYPPDTAIVAGRSRSAGGHNTATGSRGPG